MSSGVIRLIPDFLWFDSFGFSNLWLFVFKSKWLVFFIGAAIAYLWFFINLKIVQRYSDIDIKSTPLSFNTPFTQLNQVLTQLWNNSRASQAQSLPGRVYNAILHLGAVVLAVIFGLTARANWQEYLAYFHQQSYGMTDPVFGRDISYYMFSLPVFDSVHSWVFGLVFMALGVVIWTYFSKSILFLIFSQHHLSSAIRKHVGILIALLFVLMGIGAFLGRYDLLFSNDGVVFGAGYTDVNAVLPFMYIKMGLLFFQALLVLFWAFQGSIFAPVAGFAVYMIVSFLGGGIIPGIVQSYFVAPNEMQKEKPYIKRNISYTREAFNLSEMQTKQFEVSNTLTLEDLQRNETALRNIRLWNPGPLKQTFSQLQEIRLYYEFSQVDVDRYMIDGQIQQVMLSPREMVVNQLTQQAQTWINRHMVYTHGYGVVMSPVNEFSAEGLPLFYIKDLPPAAEKGLKVTRPEIYFGEKTGDYVITNTEQKEFDYPKGDMNVYTNYAGEGGVQLSSAFRRLAFAWFFSDIKILISSLITPESRLMFDRDIRTIVRKLVPFLAYDRDPYLVVTPEGRLVWMLDAYTFSERFPYSEPYGSSLNYIRNAVKVTIDAYSGETNFYVVDKKDPIIATLSSLYDGVFKTYDQMPQDLKQHMRYPRDMFFMQANIFKTYHMQDPQVFYNREDLWAIPKETYGETEQLLMPYYMVTRLPGEKENSFSLMVPFTPTNKNNMIALMVVNSDPDRYGEMKVYKFPKEKTVFGPMQIESRVDQDTEISKSLTLWGQVGSRVIRGNLMVVPIEDSLIYVEPIYLQATQSKLPELKRLIFAYDNAITMAPSIDEAISNVFQGDFSSVPKQDRELQTSTDTTKRPLDRLFKVFENVKKTAQELDWSRFGKQMDELETVIESLKQEDQN
jgi:uncharacterized membrane protein (UPF0182 family)